MTIHLHGLTDALLLAVVPLLVVLAIFMTIGLLTGPRRGGFRLVLTWPWVCLVLPTVIAGLWGIVRVMST